MLNRIKSELKVTLLYNFIFYMVMCVIDNGGIDKYLIENIFENLGDVVPYLVLITAVYLVSLYVWHVISGAVKKDVQELKNELNNGKVKA